LFTARTPVTATLQSFDLIDFVGGAREPASNSSDPSAADRVMLPSTHGVNEMVEFVHDYLKEM
jgi:hypothetical protein